MSKAIEINNLGKQYRRRELGGSRYQTLRDDLWPKGRREAAKKTDYFWALRNVDLTIEQGSIVGVIGPNGAGKSTLLKLLSRVTSPTEGSFTLRGRVASLLEVGTGFHPELTGRENIFLSGAVMGMRRAEIQRRFDEIVAFSGVENFLDLPVKRYSSGMYVRLGFAIAAHLEAEILLVDEVLAVGDAEFQKKCLGKIGDVAEGGRTVLFVSHNMGSVRQLCKESILLGSGEQLVKAKTSLVLEKYQSTSLEYIPLDQIKRRGIGMYLLENVDIYSLKNGTKNPPKHGESLIIKLKYSTRFNIEPKHIRVDLRIDSKLGERLIWLSTFSNLKKEVVNGSEVSFVIESCPLNTGDYSITVCSYYKGEINDWVDRCYYFSINYIDFSKYARVPKEQSSFVIDYKFEQS
jgi:lipopolysaccharide transport system ATP-binding protein